MVKWKQRMANSSRINGMEGEVVHVTQKGKIKKQRMAVEGD